MAQTIYVRKLYDSFVPTDLVSIEAMECMPMNAEFKCVFTLPRNLKFHRKLFVLFGIAFDAFDLGEIRYKGVIVKKNMERFRKDITIKAGFYDVVFNLEGELRLEAKSISFAKMDDEEFGRLYNECINVILEKVLTNYTKDDINEQVDRILGFS